MFGREQPGTAVSELALRPNFALLSDFRKARYLIAAHTLTGKDRHKACLVQSAHLQVPTA